MIKKMINLPIIGITMGDPSGIGPEITVNAFADENIYRFCRPIIIGDACVVEQAIRISDADLAFHSIANVRDAKYQIGKIDVFDLNNFDITNFEYGKITAESGNASFNAVKKVIELALNKEIDATVTGPINKESINKAGHKFAGHTEIYSHYTNTKKYAMLLADDNLKVVHVSTHVAMSEACKLVKKDRIIEVIQLLNEGLKKLGIENPVIAVAGLNPHASDGGLFGSEEEMEIIPAINETKKMGYIVEGPVPADTMFLKARDGNYDGCVAMYHDQGHIPFKQQGFTWDNKNKKMSSVKGVNVTLGLPIIRVSVDHGTAFEIAGKGIASADAMILSIKYASLLSQAD